MLRSDNKKVKIFVCFYLFILFFFFKENEIINTFIHNEDIMDNLKDNIRMYREIILKMDCSRILDRLKTHLSISCARVKPPVKHITRRASNNK